MGRYNSDAHKTASAKYNQGNYDEALTLHRQFVTWYILCHKAHTVPSLASNNVGANEILSIDIEALAHAVETLQLYYYQAGLIDDFPKCLDQLKDAISDERWENKIHFFMSLWNLLYKGNNPEACRCISRINMSECNDPEILTVYLDVCRDNISFQDSIRFYDRIIDNTQKESYILQYSVMKGMAFGIICEFNQASQIINTAIERYRGLKESKRTFYGDHKLAGALEALGGIKESDEILHEAVKAFLDLIERSRGDDYTELCTADLLKSLADCYSRLGQYDKAVTKYCESLDLHTSELTKVFLSRAYVNTGNCAKAQALLISLNEDDFTEAKVYDCAISWALLAAKSGVVSDSTTALSRLKSSRSGYPLFAQSRDAWIITLLENKPVDNNGLKKIVRWINRYVLFKPSIFGMGIDVNRIIEDFSADSIGRIQLPSATGDSLIRLFS
ncbi:MAG: tetratricopeptide repeat protein [Planctomycetes bacterium]|nr:tetratricopeptide repeat protein [Planctomycetota bacterium]